MQAIYRVDGKRCRHEPQRRRPLGQQHAARLGAGGAGHMGGRGDTDTAADAGRARHHRPDAPGAADPADDSRARCCARAARSSSARSGCLAGGVRRGRRDHPQDQDARAAAAGRDRGPAGRASRTRPVAPEPAHFSCSPFVTGISLRIGARPVRRARSRRDLVSGRPAAGRGFFGFAGDARRGRRGFLQRHVGGAGFPPVDVHQRRSHRQSLRASRSGSGSCSMRNPGSVPRARALPPRGSPTRQAISAAPCRASLSRSGERGPPTPHRAARVFALVSEEGSIGD